MLSVDTVEDENPDMGFRQFKSQTKEEWDVLSEFVLHDSRCRLRRADRRGSGIRNRSSG